MNSWMPFGSTWISSPSSHLVGKLWFHGFSRIHSRPHLGSSSWQGELNLGKKTKEKRKTTDEGSFFPSSFQAPIPPHLLMWNLRLRGKATLRLHKHLYRANLIKLGIIPFRCNSFILHYYSFFSIAKHLKCKETLLWLQKGMTNWWVTD